MPKTIYAARDGGTDGFDSKIIAYFTTREAAEEVARGQGPMGYGNGTVFEETLYSSAADYHENNPRAKRDAALAKLTEEDKRLLGLR